MALENIKQMTRPLSEEKKVASHDAPEDYLKRAVEQFIIEFPEFEDLQGQDLYDKMQEKGWFSDRYASGPPAFDDEQLKKGAIEIFGKPLKDLTDDEYEELEDMIREMDVSPWDFVQRKGKKDIRQVNQGGIIGLRYGGDPRIEQQPEGITQLASHTGEDVIQSAIIWAAGLPQFGSIGSVLDALNNVDHPHAMDINGLVNAYMDARVDSN